MGNKQGTASVFQDEEDEETWFEWMEAMGDRRNQKRLPISPCSDLLAVHAVQPMSLTPGVTDTAREAKQKYRSEAKALSGLYLASAKRENISVDPSFRGDAKNNNYLPKVRKGEEDELDMMTVGQVSVVKEREQGLEEPSSQFTSHAIVLVLSLSLQSIQSSVDP